ncbi:Sterol 3-beta-glucosyltransferase UGT80B1 [Paramyrothecium foliicola]|nr:Sterol 3-beta-glucosyltransferase UGT80B1 [Paramyrothecium foliicola]
MANDKRQTRRFELPGDDMSYLTPAPSYSNLQRAASTSDLSTTAVEMPADSAPISTYTPYGLASIIGNDVKVGDDARVEINADSKLLRRFSALYTRELTEEPAPGPSLSIPQPTSWATRLNIVIQVVGSRGDVQPFIALGNELQRYGHRVRLATHDTFSNFVRDFGLEFYPIGGNPAELMAFMVKNPGLIPSMKSIADGEIQRKRIMVENMLEGCWQSCLQPDPLTSEPFVADAIIANPPSFAHVHCAQALGIPIHMMFTMPWSNTKAFPHPLANLTNVSADPTLANYLSYTVVEWLTWQGLGDVINKWRRSIDLEDVPMFDAPLLAQTLRIPFTYCWSAALVPKPTDWPSYIDVCGFFFRDAPHYSPPPDLAEFLQCGPPPVYIGFGSIVLENPEKMINTILDAVKAANVRAIISKGWSELSGSRSEDIYWIGDCPHEWLFQHVAAVVHHGGAGTTACGLRNKRPTVVVPFFGDQPFWGQMIASAGAGPSPIHHQKLTAENLCEGIRYCLTQEAITAAATIAYSMASEVGVQAAAQSFHRQLPLERMQCDIFPNEPAVWIYAKSKRPIKLSKIAAAVLLDTKSIHIKDLKLYSTKSIIIEHTRIDPISGGASAVVATATDLGGSITGMVTKPIETYKDERRRRARELELQDFQSNAVSHQQDNPQKSGTSTPYRTSTDSASIKPSLPKKTGSLAGKMMGASAKSIGTFAPTALQGMMVDIPLAITEGMKSVPRHYGGKVRDHGPVVDAKSGFAVAGKTFAYGFMDGLADLVVQPYKGAAKDGALGALKGFGKGAVSLTTKSGAAMFGVLAYPSAGISKSLRTAVHSGTRKTIANERHVEGKWLLGGGRYGEAELMEGVAAFDRLRKLE